MKIQPAVVYVAVALLTIGILGFVFGNHADLSKGRNAFLCNVSGDQAACK